MIFGTPVTWFIAEILASVLFICCVAHASKQEHGTIRVLELFGFIFYAAIFENIGVASHSYDYDLHRIMLVGKVPLEVLFIEGVIFYVSLQLAEYVNIPNWGKALVVGFLASFQDMSLDPSAIFDKHLFNGIMSGQWNWTFRYHGSFFGIPFFNFTGWMYLMVFYIIAIQIGMWLYKKYDKEIIGYLYPFVASFVAVILLISPLIQFLLYARPFFPQFTRGAELVMLCINCLIGIFILLRYMKIGRPFELKRDWIFLFVPIVLHAYDLIIAFNLRIQNAIIPVTIISALHITLLMFIYTKGKKIDRTVAKHKDAIKYS